MENNESRTNQSAVYGTATIGVLFTQLALHEMHHRAQVMAMLRLMRESGANIPGVQDIDYNDLMYERREANDASANSLEFN